MMLEAAESVGNLSHPKQGGGGTWAAHLFAKTPPYGQRKLLVSCWAAPWAALGPAIAQEENSLFFFFLTKPNVGGHHAGRDAPVLLLTSCAEEGCIELPGNQGIRHVPKKLFEQSSHIMNTLMLIQENIQSLVKLFPQLKDGRTEKNKSNSQLFPCLRVELVGSAPVQSYCSGGTGGLATPSVPSCRSPPGKVFQSPAACCCPEPGPEGAPGW